MKSHRHNAVDSIREGLIERVNEAFEAVNELTIAQPLVGLNSIHIRNWLMQDVDVDRLWCGRFIGTSGIGPWDIDEFDSFLESLGFSVGFLPNPEFDVVVLGEQSFDEDAIQDQIGGSARNQPIFLSQELFVASLIKNEHPYDLLNSAAIDEAVSNHPGLSYAVSCGYEPQDPSSPVKIIEWEADVTLARKSPLGFLGYSARKDALTEFQRRQKLDEFFTASKLPLVDSEQDKRKWGKARSPQRLYSLNNFLSWLAVFNGAEAPLAREIWLSDLDWLKAKYYNSKMGFTWKSPVVQRSSYRSSASTSISGKNSPARFLDGPKLNPQAAWPFAMTPSRPSKR